MLTLTSKRSLEKLEKFRQAFYEDLKKDKPYLVSAILASIVNDGFLFFDGIEEVEKQIKYLFSFASKFMFLNGWIPNKKYSFGLEFSRYNYGFIEYYLDSNKLRILTKDKIDVFGFYQSVDFSRVDFKFSDEDVRKLYSFYLEEEQEMEEVILLQQFEWLNE